MVEGEARGASANTPAAPAEPVKSDNEEPAASETNSMVEEIEAKRCGG